MASSSSRRSWDVPEWDEDPDLEETNNWTFDEDLPEKPPTKREGEIGLAQYLVQRYLRGQMTTVDVCVLAHWASAAGAGGEVREVAKAPGTGHYSRHLHRVLKVQEWEERLMKLRVPSHDKKTKSIRSRSKWPPCG